MALQQVGWLQQQTNGKGQHQVSEEALGENHNEHTINIYLAK